MAEITTKVAPDLQGASERSVLGVIIASATEAFTSAVMVWLLGGIAFSAASTFTEDMVPSPPPFYHGQHSGKSPDAHDGDDWGEASGYVLAIFFAIFFAHSLWVGFHGRGIVRGGRLQRIVNNLREDWFSLIVTNALTAYIAVEVLKLGQEISLWNMVWQWIWEVVGPIFGGAGKFVLGPAKSSTLGQWFSWYGDNQMKLNFWIIYLAGAFDDLGVPNYKTLARWGWRRYKKRQLKAASAA